MNGLPVQNHKVRATNPAIPVGVGTNLHGTVVAVGGHCKKIIECQQFVPIKPQAAQVGGAIGQFHAMRDDAAQIVLNQAQIVFVLLA